MTRQYFLDNYTTLYDLKEFCDTYGFYSCEDLYSASEAQDVIMREVREYDRWEYALGYLENIPRNCEWYAISDGDVSDADGSFEDYRHYILEETDNCEYWEIDEDEIVEDESEYGDPVPEEAEILFAADIFSNLISGAS